MGSGSSKKDSDSEVIESDDDYALIKNWHGEVSTILNQRRM